MDFAETCRECSPGSIRNSSFFILFLKGQIKKFVEAVVFNRLARVRYRPRGRFRPLGAIKYSEFPKKQSFSTAWQRAITTALSRWPLCGHFRSRMGLSGRRGPFQARRVISGHGGPFFSGKWESILVSVFFSSLKTKFITFENDTFPFKSHL